MAAAGTLAAGSLGGVLVPPLLGVGAYLMLRLLEGQLTLPGLLAASIFPALLYFFSLYLCVALRARRDEAENERRREDSVALLLLPELPAQKPVYAYSGVLLAAGLAAFLAPILAGWPVAGAALELLEVDQLGLDDIDRRMLRAIIEKFGGGPVGLNTVAAAISEDQATIENVYELFLIQLGFIARTPRGRVAMPAAYEHLGIAVPANLPPAPDQPTLL